MLGMLMQSLCSCRAWFILSKLVMVVACSNAFEDPELGFSDQQHSEAAPLSRPSPYDVGHKTAAVQLQDRPQK